MATDRVRLTRFEWVYSSAHRSPSSREGRENRLRQKKYRKLAILFSHNILLKTRALQSFRSNFPLSLGHYAKLR